MENIKQLREKIESFISCGDKRCPTLSERYQNHLLKHHSVHNNQTQRSNTPSMRSNLSLPSYSKEKSTVSLGVYAQENPSKIGYNSLRKEIMERSKDLPVYYNPKFEEMKQNAINELIEHIISLVADSNTSEKSLDKLKHEITEMITSIPLTYEQHKHFETNLIQILRRFKSKNIKNNAMNYKDNIKIKSRNNVIYQEINTKKSGNKKDPDVIQNSYIDIIKSISPVLLTDFKLTSIENDCNSYSQLYKCGTSVVLRSEDYKTKTVKILSLQFNNSRTQVETIENGNIFPLPNYTAVIAKCQNIFKHTASDIRNKLNLSNVRKIAGINELRIKVSSSHELINATTRGLQDSKCDGISIRRSENIMNNKNSNLISATINDERNLNKKETSVQNMDENTFKKYIANEIKSWMITLPTNRNDTQKICRDPPIKYLVNNLVDYYKIDPFFSENKNVKENCINYFVMNWLYKTNVLHNINNAKPHVDSFIERFNDKNFCVYFNNNSDKIISLDQSKNTRTTYCDEDTLKSDLLNWLTEKKLLLQHNLKLNKKNRAISKLSKSLYVHITKKESYGRDDFGDVIKLFKKILKPELKDDVEILLKELVDRLYSAFPKAGDTSEKLLANDKTQASTCIKIEIDTLECSLKRLLQKYVIALSEEESILVKDVNTKLFKAKIQSMLDSKLCTKNYEMKRQENDLSFQLKTDIEYIDILIDWIKCAQDDKTIFNLQANTEILMEIIAILNTERDNNITDIPAKERIENCKRRILHGISTSQCVTKDTEKRVNELVQKHLRLIQHNQNTKCKECFDQNRSDVIEAYIHLHSEDIVNENVVLSIFLKRILREIRYHCMCHLSSILLHNDFEYVKEICNWLNNLPLLSSDDNTFLDKIVTMVSDFIYEIKRAVEQQDDGYITEFIKALPVNKCKGIDIKLATLQVKKRLQYVDNNHEKDDEQSKEKTRLDEEHIAKIDIVKEIENWCQNLPIANDNVSVIIKQRLAWNLLKKVGELNMKSEYCGIENKILYENDVTVELDTQLNNLPSNDTLTNEKDLLKKQLLSKIIENFDFVEAKHPVEKYVIHLTNLIELSLRGNANIVTEEDSVLLHKIRDGLVALTLLKQFIEVNKELTAKYYLFIMEEICAYLQYAKALFIVPFLLDVNDDLFSYDLTEYHNDPITAKLLKAIKTKSVLGNWIETLPLEKPNGLKEVIDKYEMVGQLTDLVIEIENQYNYNDSDINGALTKCLQILPQSLPNQEHLILDLKKILTSTLNERNNNVNSSEKSNNLKLENTAESQRPQNGSKTQWYTIPLAHTANDDTGTKYDSHTSEKYKHEEKSRKSSNRSSLLSYGNFEKGVNLKSSSTKQTDHHSTLQDGPNYESFKKGVDFKSSLIELSPMRQESTISELADFTENKCNSGPPKEENISCTETQMGQKSSSPIKIEEQLDTNNCVPSCKPSELKNHEKSSQTHSLGKSSQTCQEKTDKTVMGECNDGTEKSDREDRDQDTTCKCHRKCLPCYIRRYCKICNSFPLRYPEFHYW